MQGRFGGICYCSHIELEFRIDTVSDNFMTTYKNIDFQINDFDKGLALAEEFDELLNCDSEETIHKFLYDNPILMNCLCDEGAIVFSKFKLADDFIPDFIFLGQEMNTNAMASYISLVEIERSDKLLFTKSGDPSSFLTHAIRQVQNWKTWFEENRTSLRKKFKDIVIQNPPILDQNISKYQRRIEHFGLDYGFYARYYCVIGRREHLTIKDNILLGQMNHDLSGISIITYDVLLEKFINQLKKAKYGFKNY